ncbi:uncharacterized protein LAESUDRAFT_728865 [Laetiporus sulphureus 93-53]|uniref:DUF6534 domain-containing protein n=1 Tax=Laetiporus sulphureus 93-53 TaxID=1314785 RepID=A0A165D037_9APHY|nr:uncharacterized protein LAESUDRAFT_728865 [Laetiporus sulphureus 93-53]KZT03865.1 hypothetical protein LAESUDRAFT_728865 [Laetiporus sulphureus 93-53]
MITVVLCTVLTAQNTGFRHTKNLISKLTFYLLNRGILTAACQFFFFVLWHIFDKKNEYVWTLFSFPGSQVYVNSMLAILNARLFFDPPKNQASIQEIPMHYMSGLAGAASSSRPTISIGRSSPSL